MFLPGCVKKLLKRAKKLTINSKHENSAKRDEDCDEAEIKLVRHHTFKDSHIDPSDDVECARSRIRTAADLDRRLDLLRRRRSRAHRQVVTFAASTPSSTGATVVDAPPFIVDLDDSSMTMPNTPRRSRIAEIVNKKTFQPYVPSFQLSRPSMVTHRPWQGYEQNASHFRFKLTPTDDNEAPFRSDTTLGVYDLDDTGIETPSPDSTMPSPAPLIAIDY
uniref:Uncharacterized protein n=1 Tax=Panagrellus redivivus TaxID=6233 RepID=A0A7E4VE43_PANRE